MTKAELRRWARQRRKALDLAAFAAQALPHLAGLLAGRRRVLLYAPLPHEPDPRGVARLLPEARFYLPRVEGEELAVLPLDAPLVPGAFGVLEPAGGEPLPPEALDAVVVPALAFDRRGFRLGQGKGYYDRFLKRLARDALTVGFVPEALVLDELPTDPWDVPVRAIVTEAGVLEPGVPGPQDAPF